MKKVVAFLVVTLMVVLCSGAYAADEILIGSVNDLSGSRSVTGNAINRGAQIAADEINAAGGVLGKQIKFISYDNKNDGQESINAYTRLADVDNVSAVIAPDASGICLTLIEISNEKKVPIVGMPSDPRATMNVETGVPHPYMFLVAQPNAIGQAELVASYLKDNTKWEKAAVFYDQSNAYAVVSCEAFMKAWKALGKTVSIVETCNANDQDFRTQLSKIGASDAEFIYNPNPTVQLVLMVHQAAQLGIELPHAGGMDMANPFLSLLNDPAAVSLAYFETSAWMTDPRLDALNTEYNKRFGEDAMVKAVNGYDAMYILKAAIEAAGSAEPEAVREALENKINGIKILVSDNYSHDPATHAPKNLGMVMCKIENGVLTNQGFYEIHN